MCGFLGTDAPNDPLIQILPSVLKIDVADAVSADWIESSLRVWSDHSASGLPVGKPSTPVLPRYSILMRGGAPPPSASS